MIAEEIQIGGWESELSAKAKFTFAILFGLPAPVVTALRVQYTDDQDAQASQFGLENALIFCLTGLACSFVVWRMQVLLWKNVTLGRFTFLPYQISYLRFSPSFSYLDSATLFVGESWRLSGPDASLRGSNMEIKWTDWVQAIVGVVGIPLIVYQLHEVRRTIQGQTLSELYDHYHHVLSELLKKPELRPYFYENKIPEKDNPTLDVELESMCELFAAVMEHACVQKKNVPFKSWQECWETFVKERQKKSAVLRNYLHVNRDWYLKDLQCLNPDSEGFPLDARR